MEAIGSGQSHHGRFKRFRNNGDVVWLEASYFPIKNSEGLVEYITKIAKDVTREVLELEHQVAVSAAIDKSMATIEFSPSGEIIRANKNF